jgi:hypothetical protein
MDLPILPGSLLLDATSDIDGVTQIAPWRSPVHSPSVTFGNLTVSYVPFPENMLAPNEKVSEIVKKMQRARPYVDWIKQTVVENTEPGEKVLAVVHKSLIENLDLFPDSQSLDDDTAYDLEGRKVAWINWGYGIGSNRWASATAVLLFGEFSTSPSAPQ